jgi:predicted dehydrogenase
MTDVSIGLAGAGYWGSKLARNIFEARGSHLAAIADGDTGRREATLHRYPSARGVRDLDELLADGDIEAVVLATPASLHAEHARAALESGKHVLVEKPLALTTADCDALIATAEDAGRILMVGHTFLYSEPVRMLRRYVAEGTLGELLYVYGQRVNLGVIREDLNALWNFGPHDVSILLYLLDELPTRISLQQYHLLNRSLEDVAFLVLEFPSGVIGHVHESWLDPRKVRQFTVVGTRKMVVYDDTDVEGPLRVFDKGVSPEPLPPEAESVRAMHPEEGFGEFKLAVRSGDLLVPRVTAREPLRVEVEHFVDCVSSSTVPLTDGAHGRAVVAVLEAAERSASEGGRSVSLEQPVGER